VRRELEAARTEGAEAGARTAAALAERDRLSRDAETAVELGAQLQAARAESERQRGLLAGVRRELDAARTEGAEAGARTAAALAEGVALREELATARRHFEQEREKLRDQAERQQDELEAVRADVDEARRQAARAAVDQARTSAAHEERQQQLGAVRRQDEEEKERLRAEAQRLRRQFDEALRRVESLTAEGKLLRERADREEEGRVLLQEKYDALTRERDRNAAEESARRPTSVPEVVIPEVVMPKIVVALRSAAAVAAEPEPALTSRQRQKEERAAAPPPRPPRQPDHPAAAAGPAAETVRTRGDRFPLWACLPLAVFLWAAGLSVDSPPTGRAVALQVLFALTLLLQFRLWDDLEDATAAPAPSGRDRVSSSSRGALQVVFAFALAWNTAYLAFQQKWPLLGLFLGLDLASFLWYKGLRRLCPGPVAESQVAALKYPALAYLVAAPATGLPDALLPALAVVYLCFSVFELLHDGRLRAAQGSAAVLALAMALMLGISGVVAARLYDGGGLAPVVQVVLTGLGSAVLLALLWRRATGRAPGVGAYLVFLIGLAWLVNFSPVGRELVLPALQGLVDRMAAVAGP
jgi:hypothetical protein